MVPQQEIDNYLKSLPVWQRKNLETFRKLVHKVAPDVVEEWKWSVPVFLVNKKMRCAMSAFKEHTKFNFFGGADLEDKHKLFNNGLDSKRHRSIDLNEGDRIDAEKLTDLLTEALK